MNENPSVPIPQSEHLNAANPFDDSSNQRSPASGQGPITSPAPGLPSGAGSIRPMGGPQNPSTPGTPNPNLMSPPPPGGAPAGMDHIMGSQGIPHSPGMQHPNFGGPGGPGHPGGPTSNPGMPGQPQNFPQMNGQWPPQMMQGYRPPPMMHPSGQRMNDMSRMPGIPGGMPPGGQFHGFPGTPMGGSMLGYPSQPNPNVININNTNIITSTHNNMPTHIFRPYSGGQDNVRMPPGSGPGPGSGGGITMNGPSSEPKFETKVEPSDETLVPNEILDLFPNEPSSDTPTPKNEPVQCGMCQKQIYPNQDFEELVRCYSCSKWFKRTCVGINEVAYKQLVNEQNHCAWCCDNCIGSKPILSIMPKHDNNNQCTNQPLTAQSIGEKPEPKERKKRKNTKANGKAKAAPAAMPPPMGGMERGMRPGMGQMGMNPAMINPRMMMNPRMPHMMTPHGPMGNLPMGMMGNRGPMGMGGPPGGPMGMGPGGPGMPSSGQFNPMASPQPGVNPMTMNTDSTGPGGIPTSGQTGPGGPGPGQVPQTSVSMPNNWPMMNGNQPFNPQQFNQQQPPPPTSVSDFNPSSLGDINPSSFNTTPNVPTTSCAIQQSISGGQSMHPAVGVNQSGQSRPNHTSALPDLDTSNLDGLDIPTGVDTSGVTPNSQSAMDINNILGNLTSDAPPSATGGSVQSTHQPVHTAPSSGQNDAGLPPVSTSSLPTSIPSSVPPPTEPNPTQIPSMEIKENVEKIPTPPNSIAPPTTTPTQPDENQPMTDSVAPPEPPPPLVPQGGTPGLETNESNPNNEPTETE